MNCENQPNQGFLRVYEHFTTKKSARMNISTTDKTHCAWQFQCMFAKQKIILLWPDYSFSECGELKYKVILGFSVIIKDIKRFNCILKSVYKILIRNIAKAMCFLQLDAFRFLVIKHLSAFFEKSSIIDICQGPNHFSRVIAWE